MFASRPGKAPTAAAKNAFNSIRAARLATPSFTRHASSSAQAGAESLRLAESGRPLDAGERGEFEPRFDFSFANVRVHDGAEAANAAKAVGARAFTLGNHIVFGAGARASGSAEGRATLAHELAHVVQHGGTPAQRASTISSPADAGEREADAIAAKVRAAEPGPLAIRTRILPSVLHRQIVHMASGRFVGDMKGEENNKREEVLSVLDKLGELGAISQPDYAEEYKHVSGLQAGTPVDPKAIHATTLGIQAFEKPTLDVATAKKELNLKLWNDVGKGRENNKVDVLAVQDQLHTDGHLTDTAYRTDRATVGVLPRDAKVDGDKVTKTMTGISEQKNAILGGRTGSKYRHAVAVSTEMEKLFAKKAEATWVSLAGPGSSKSASKSDPNAIGDTFDTWAMAKSADAAGPLPPVTPATKLNCWEMVLLSALRVGVTTWRWVHDVYSKAAKSGDWKSSLVDALSRGARTPYNYHFRTDQPQTTPRPNRGQVVFFDQVAHVALATGQTQPGKLGGIASQVMSFWPPPAKKAHEYTSGTADAIQRTTIEELVPPVAEDSGDEVKVEFSQPPW